MSCPRLPSVWDALKSRTDIDGVVYEVFGEHALGSACLPDTSQERRKLSMRLVVKVRLVLDLQRTYLQNEHLPGTVRSYLLRPGLVYFALRKLIYLGFLSHPPDEGSSLDDSNGGSLIAQTVLSGIRVLMLQSRAGEYLNFDRKRALNADLRDVRNSFQATLTPGIDNCSIWTVCIECLRFVKTNVGDTVDEDVISPACSKFELPAYTTGLYPFNPRFTPDFMTQDLDSCINDIISPGNNWLRGYWAILDLAWALDAALIASGEQEPPTFSSAGRRGSREPSPADHIRSLRTPFLCKICKTLERQGRPDIFRSLDVTLLGWHDENALGTPSPPFTSSFGSNPLGNNIDVENALWELQSLLRARKSNAGKEVAGKFRDYTLEWARKASFPHTTYEDPKNSHYVLNCPELHVISQTDLRGRLRDAGIEYQHISSTPSILRGLNNIDCPSCVSRRQISCARLIEPLNKMTADLEDRSGDGQRDSRELLTPPRTSGSDRRTSDTTSFEQGPSGASSNSDGVSIDTTRSDRSIGGRIRNRFASISKSASRDSVQGVNAPLSLRFCFTASGNGLLLWDSGGKPLIIFDLPVDQGYRYDPDPGDIRFVAGGDRKVAVITKNENVYNLIVYDRISKSLDFENPLDPNDIERSITSIAVSRDDRYVVLACTSYFLVISLEDGRTIINRQDIMLPVSNSNQEANNSQAEVDGRSEKRFTGESLQVINFDFSSEYVVVASHIYKKLRIAVFPRNDDGTATRQRSIDLTETFHPDNRGLRSIHYHPGFRTVILGAFLKDYDKSPVIPLDGTSLGLPVRDNKVHAIAQSPFGRYYAVMYPSKLHSISLQTGIAGSAEVKPFPKRTIKKECDLAAVAMPGSNTFYVFWVEGPKLCLQSISHGDDQLLDIRSRYDALIDWT